MSPRLWPRLMALGMLAGAVLDPGCDDRRRAAVEIVAADGASPALIESVRVAARRQGLTLTEEADAGPTVRVGVGTPRALAVRHAVTPFSFVVRPAEVPPHVIDVTAPRIMVAGVASRLRVRVDGVQHDAESPLQVRVRDLSTGQQVGAAAVEAQADGAGWTDVPLLPLAPGVWTLGIGVAHDGTEPAPADADERVVVQVLDDRVQVEVIEARPSWAARFARLALERWPTIRVVSQVRLAAGVDVTATPGPATGAVDASVPAAPQVLLVGGLDALTRADVSRLVAVAREDATTIVLLVDTEGLDARVRALWPHPPGRLATAPQPRRIGIGAHHWLAREWLGGTQDATDVDVLAYVDATPPVPIVLSRPLGAGRVVLVAALDAWRWRLDDEAAFDEAWQALVLSLAADRAALVQPMAWRVPGPLADDVQVRLPAVDVAGAADGPPPGVRVGESAAEPLPVAAATRGGVAVVGRVARDAAQVPIVVANMVVGGDAGPVIEVGSASTVPSGWLDVERVLSATAGAVVAEGDVAGAFARLDVPRVPAARWYVSRQWWYAALVIGLLSLEWWWRRLARAA